MNSFKELNLELKKVRDIRQSGNIIYIPDIILFMVIMKNSCSITSMTERTIHLTQKNVLGACQRYLMLN